MEAVLEANGIQGEPWLAEREERARGVVGRLEPLVARVRIAGVDTREGVVGCAVPAEQIARHLPAKLVAQECREEPLVVAEDLPEKLVLRGCCHVLLPPSSLMVGTGYYLGLAVGFLWVAAGFRTASCLA